MNKNLIRSTLSVVYNKTWHIIMTTIAYVTIISYDHHSLSNYTHQFHVTHHLSLPTLIMTCTIFLAKWTSDNFLRNFLLVWQRLFVNWKSQSIKLIDIKWLLYFNNNNNYVCVCERARRVCARVCICVCVRVYKWTLISIPRGDSLFHP